MADDFLDDPRVETAVDALTEALRKATGGTLKALVIAAHTPTRTGVVSGGCTCVDCSATVITAIAEALGAEVQVGDEPDGDSGQARVH